MKHPKCKMALEKDDELYNNFILQFDSRRKHEQSTSFEQSTSTSFETKRQEVGVRGNSVSDSSHNSIGDSLCIVEKKEE
jgi:hypothetical protein